MCDNVTRNYNHSEMSLQQEAYGSDVTLYTFSVYSPCLSRSPDNSTEKSDWRIVLDSCTNESVIEESRNRDNGRKCLDD